MNILNDALIILNAAMSILNDAMSILNDAMSTLNDAMSNVIDIIIRASQALDENNVPESGRWIVIPAWVASRIKNSELKDASLTGDGASILRNGRLGQIDRFTLYMSNLLPQATVGANEEYTVYFGHSVGLTFASQVTKVETLRSEKTFGTIMRGLQVYGRQVVKPVGLGQIICTPN